MDRLSINPNISSEPLPSSSKVKGKGFGQRLKKAIEEVNDFQQNADSAMTQVVKGSMGIHEGMMAISKADISLRLLLQVRNKVMDAYREISRMGF